MKRMLAFTICSIVILSMVSGCAEEKQSSDQSAVNSGSLNEKYVGDPNVVITEEYKQTTGEAKSQEELLKALEEEANSFEGGGLSGH